MTDTINVAGILNVVASYTPLASKEEALEARRQGQVVVEEAHGKRSELVAYWDVSEDGSKVLVLHRVLSAEDYETFHTHFFDASSPNRITIRLHLNKLSDGSGIVDSVVTLEKSN